MLTNNHWKTLLDGSRAFAIPTCSSLRSTSKFKINRFASMADDNPDWRSLLSASERYENIQKM